MKLKQAYVMDVLGQHQREEITHSRMVELLNEGHGITENVRKFREELEHLGYKVEIDYTDDVE